MEASTGPPCLPTPPIEPNIEKIKQKLLKGGFVPTPKIIHTLRKKELQKLNRRLAKQAAKQPVPLLTDSQKQTLAEDSHFRMIKSEYKNFTKLINQGKKMVGRPWERLDKLKLRELASESQEYSGENLKTEHLRELSDIVERERGKLQWLLQDDIEVEEGLFEQENSSWAPPKRCLSEAEAIRFFVERLSGTELSVKDWKFSRMMKQSGLQFTEKQMLKILAGLGERGHWKHALSVVEWVYNSKEHRQYKSRFVYTKLLAILGKARRPHEALQVFNFMRGDGHIYPDMAAYHSVAVTLGQAGLLKKLLNVIQFMKEKPKKLKNMQRRNWDPELQPDVVIYNAVLNACVPTQQWRGVSWVFEQLRKSGLRPNGATYGLAMEVMLQSGKYNLVHEFFGKMKRSGEALKALTYKVLVRAFWEEGKVNEALEAVRDMERRGIIGTPCVYYELARCLCFHGRCQEGILEVEKLKDIHRTRPLEITFTGMILAALDGGHVSDCLTIYEHCKQNCKHDIGIINAILKVYGRNDMFLEAKELFEEIKGNGSSSGSYLNEFGSYLPNPDMYTFTLMLEASASAEQWEYFEYVYKDMTLFGHRFDQRKHASLLVEASRAGKWHLLEHAFDTVLEAGELPPPSFFTEMLCHAAVQLDYDKVAAIINAMTHAPFQVSEQQWIEVFAAYGDRITKASLKQILDALCSHDLAREATIDNLSRALQSLCGVCSSSNLITGSGNEVVGILPVISSKMIPQGDGSMNFCDPPANIAGLSPFESIQVKRTDVVSMAASTHTSNHREEDSDLEIVSNLYTPVADESPNQCTMIAHSYQDLASTPTFWKRNSDSIEDEDGDIDTDMIQLEVSANGNGDSDDHEFNAPSADEILNIWKESIKNDGLSFQFPLSRS